MGWQWWHCVSHQPLLQHLHFFSVFCGQNYISFPSFTRTLQHLFLKHVLPVRQGMSYFLFIAEM